MMALGRTRSISSGSALAILAQRSSGPYRAAICQAESGRPGLVVTLDHLNVETLRYELVAMFEPERLRNVIEALSELKHAGAEVARMLETKRAIAIRECA